MTDYTIASSAGVILAQVSHHDITDDSEAVAETVIAARYGDGTAYATLNEYGESGLTLALARGDVDADDIRAMIAEAIAADRAQR